MNMTDGNVQSENATPIKRVYCHCAYANIIERPVKLEVLQRLSESDAVFETVADLCEMSANKDPNLARLAESAKDGQLVIAACYPRAVRWLFHAAKSPLPEGENVTLLNMREATAENVVQCMINGQPMEETAT